MFGMLRADAAKEKICNAGSKETKKQLVKPQLNQTSLFLCLTN